MELTGSCQIRKKGFLPGMLICDYKYRLRSFLGFIVWFKWKGL
jgi:hypothetical protein